MTRRIVDLTGQKFGRLLVLKQTNKRIGGTVVWKCKCSCGNISFVRSKHLIHGETKSCGCLQRETRIKNISGAVIKKRRRPLGMSRNEWRRLCSKNLDDLYVKTVLKLNFKALGIEINNKIIDDELLNIKRKNILMYRLIKKMKGA